MNGQSDAGTVQEVHCLVSLSGRQLPWLPPKYSMWIHRMPGTGQDIHKFRHPLRKGYPVTTGARAELAAQPGILIIGIAQQIVHSRILLMKILYQLNIPRDSSLIGNTLVQ